MKGKARASGRVILSGTGFKAAIGAVIALAISLIFILLIFLPTVENKIEAPREISGFELENSAIGVDDDLSQVIVIVHYSDGSPSERVTLGSMIPSGLDVSRAGEYNVVLSWGGFEQTIPIKVQNVDVSLRYSVGGTGGYIQGKSQQYIPNGGSGETVVAVPETGFVFAGWSDKLTPYPTRKDIGVTQDKEVIAIFEKARFRVIFYFDDGTIASEETVTYMEQVTKVPNPDSDPKMKKYGYEFVNWVPEKFDKIDRDMIIRPEYVKRATDVELYIPPDQFGNAMGETDIREEGFYAHGATASITAMPYNSRVLDHWLVEAWTKVNGVDTLSFLKIPADTNSSPLTFLIGEARVELAFTSVWLGSATPEYYKLSFIPNADIPRIRLRAVFAYSSYSVTFINYQNSLPQNKEDTLYLSDLPHGSPLSSYEKYRDWPVQPASSVVGMLFLGWYVEGDVTQTLIDNSAMFLEPVRLIAKWQKNPYTLYFMFTNPNAPALDTATVFHETRVYYQDAFASGTAADGSTSGIPLQSPTYDRFVFLGWIDALTLKPVDDRTRLTYQPQYEGNTDFEKNGRLYFIPLWESVKHNLSVVIHGAGTVAMTSRDYFGRQETLYELKGEYIIRENYTYELTFAAAVGYALSEVAITYNGQTKFLSQLYPSGFSNVILSLDERYDNDVAVSFEIISFRVAITNGTDDYKGRLTYSGAVYADKEIVLSVPFESPLNILIQSWNALYSIADIVVSYLDGGITQSVSYAGSLQEETTSFTLVWARVRSNTGISIVYSVRKYAVNVVQPAASGNQILTFDYYTGDFEGLAPSYAEYDYGAPAYIRISAKNTKTERSYISGLIVNGIAVDLYSENSSGIDFLDRVINCDPANVSSVIRDARITTVDIRFTVTSNLNITATFADIKYNVTATDASARASYVIGAPTVGFLGSSTVSVRPSVGYEIAGYYLNGSSVLTPIVTADPKAEFTLPLTNITSDLSYVFDLRPVSYRALFTNRTPSYDVYVGSTQDASRLLNVAEEFNVEYRSEETFTIEVLNGKRIERIRINGGADLPILQNASVYTLKRVNIDGAFSVEIWCNEPISPTENSGGYTVNFALMQASASARYSPCDKSNANTITIIADTGRVLSLITVVGTGGTYSVLNYIGETSVTFTIPVNTFNNGTAVTITVQTEPVQISIAVRYGKDESGNVIESGGTFTEPPPSVAYGTSVSVFVTAFQKYHIKSFKIRYGNSGAFEELPFTRNWSELYYNNDVRMYERGTYTFIAVVGVEIEIVFERNSYSVTVDARSINGETAISALYYDNVTNAWVGRGHVSTAFDGERLVINMKAALGYHIAEVYVNTIKMNYVPSALNINENNEGIYTYEGNYLSGTAQGVEGKIVVRVVYEINRYSFNFDIINASANFKTDNNSGTLSAEYTLDGRSYTGIPHGANFSIELNPAASNGYELFSVRIYYRAGGETAYADVTHDINDGTGLILARGGIVWFNRFMGYSSGQGITANIDLIEVVYKRKFYSVNLNMLNCTDVSGTMDLRYQNANNLQASVILLGSDGKEYLYKTDGKIYQTVGGVDIEVPDLEYAVIDGKLTYLIYENGRFIYRKGGARFEFLIEHGIRYTVLVTPATGYERTLFMINGAAASAVNNSASTNITRDTFIDVTYEIMRFTVTFSVLTLDPTGTYKVSNLDLENYMAILFTDMTDNYSRERGRDNDFITVENVPYGHFIKLTMTAKYTLPYLDGQGYYLSQFTLNGNRTAVTLDPTDPNVWYFSGFEVTSAVRCQAAFEIKKFDIYASVKNGFEYDYIDGGYKLLQEEIITNETGNTLSEERSSKPAQTSSGFVIIGTVAWGQTAVVRVGTKAGYELNSLWIDRINAAIDGTDIRDSILSPMPNMADIWPDIDMVFNALSEITNERNRTAVYIYRVQSDVQITAGYNRQKFNLTYRITSGDAYFDSITTTLDNRNPNYYGNEKPSVTWTQFAGSNLVSTRYYDELRTVIVPSNGYEIFHEGDAIIILMHLLVNGQPLIDGETGRPIIKEIICTLIEPSNKANNAVYFDFNPTGVRLDYVISDLRIEMSFVVKKYTLKSNATFTPASGNANGTAVNIDIEGRDPALLNSKQTSVTSTFVPHHAYIIYSFLAPAGFMLDYFSVNGKRFDNLYEFKDLVNGTPAVVNNDYRIQIVAAKRTVDGLTQYEYTIRIINVNDRLLRGESGFLDASADIVVNMEIKPISYNVMTYINGNKAEKYGTDGLPYEKKMMDVVTAVSVDHFLRLNVAPSPWNGYKITSFTIYYGDDINMLGVLSYSTVFTEESYNISSAVFTSNDIRFKQNYIYLVFTAEIKTYDVSINAYAYYYEDGFNEEVIPFTGSGKGTLTVKPENSYSQPFTTYEFFTRISINASSTPNYYIDRVEEFYNGEWRVCTDKLRGLSITYTPDTNGNRTCEVTFEINDIGHRTLRVVFKQKVTVTVHVRDPYKYYGGTLAVGAIEYLYYTTVTAASSGVTLSSKYPAGNYTVIDTYQYDVLVGNYLTLTFLDRINSSTVGDFYTLSNGNIFTKNDAVKNGAYQIRGAVDFYLITEINNRITYRKDASNAATSTTANGGSITFTYGPADSKVTEPNNQTLSNSFTRENNVVKITVKALENYMFKEMRVRQIDVELSKLQGKKVFKTGTSQWLTYNAATFSSLDSNKFDITESVVGSGYLATTTYTITMRGDMELEFVFYRVYEFEFAVQYADKTLKKSDLVFGNPYTNSIGLITDGSDITSEVVSGTNLLEGYYEFNGTDTYRYYVTYGTYLKLKSPDEPAGYKFMGWYTNDVNSFANLSSILPGNAYTALGNYRVNSSYLTLASGGTEVTSLRLIAVYQPLITVAVINELYYYNEKTGVAWNSWNTGILSANAYLFENNRLPLNERQELAINDQNPRYIDDKGYLTQIADISGGSYLYSPAHSLELPVNDDTRFYSAVKMFNVFMQNVTDGEYKSYTWKTGSIKLSFTPFASINFSRWEYFNWKTNSYSVIGQGVNSEISYILSLDTVMNGLPYAVRDASDNVRPLIIRPVLWKSVEVKLSKAVYTSTLGSGLKVHGKDNFSFEVSISPKIAGDNKPVENCPPNHMYISGLRDQGTFEYGATIYLEHYVSKTGILPDDTNYSAGLRYRFVGYFLEWQSQADLILTRSDGSLYTEDEYNSADPLVAPKLRLVYKFGDAPMGDGTTINIQARYVAQHLQTIVSYNVAGGTTFEEAAGPRGMHAFNNAPSIYLDYAGAVVSFTGLNFAAGSEVKGINIAKTLRIDGAEKVTVTTDKTGRWELEFFADCGISYNLYINRRRVGYATSSESEKTSGYDPDFDKPYMYWRNKGLGAGRGEIKAPNFIETASGFFTGGSNANLRYKTFTVQNDNNGNTEYMTLELQYYSTAVLRFYNMMRRSGIALPSYLAQLLGGQQIGGSFIFTAWDNMVYNYKLGSFNGAVAELGTIDGVVEIKIDLVALGNLFGSGYFNYALNGFSTGNYIQAYKLNEYERLFDPSDGSYQRYVNIDYNDFVKGGTLLFGNAYAETNTGNGIDDTNAYRIYNTVQLMNIDVFYNANGTCRVTELTDGMKNSSGYFLSNAAIGNPIYFKLYADIALQAPSTSANKNINPADGTMSWKPICYAYENDGNNDIHKGFDGELNGLSNGVTHYLYGLAVGRNTADNATTLKVPSGDTQFDYDKLNGYGIFGSVNGGAIRNVNIGNSYIMLYDFTGTGKTGARPDYVGVLTARAYDATFVNVTFKEGDNPSSSGGQYTNGTLGTSTNVYFNVNRNTAAPFGTATTYVYAPSSYGVGLLAGLVVNCDMRNVSVVTTAGTAATSAGSFTYYISGGGTDTGTVDLGFSTVGGTVSSGTGLIAGIAASKGGGMTKFARGSDATDSQHTVHASSNSNVFVNYDSDLTTYNSGAAFGTVYGKAFMSDLSLYSTASARVYIGFTGNKNSGGLIGAVYSPYNNCTVVRPMVRSDLLRPIGSSNAANSVTNLQTSSKAAGLIGIYITAMRQNSNTKRQDGNAGGVVGANYGGQFYGVGADENYGPQWSYDATKSAKLSADDYPDGLKYYDTDATHVSKSLNRFAGTIYFYAVNMGGIAGENSRFGQLRDECGLLQGFILSANNGVSPANFYFRTYRDTTAASEYFMGGIVGKNASYGAVNDCAFEGNSLSSQNTIASAVTVTSTTMYTFNLKDENDTRYRAIDANSSDTNMEVDIALYQMTVNMGGIAGITSGKLFNSYLKSTKIVSNFQNGVSNNDYDWKVFVGGIAGAFRAAGLASGSYGYDTAFVPPPPISNGVEFTEPISKISSCYTDGCVIVSSGHIYMDSPGTPSSRLGLDGFLGTNAASIGGIVGDTGSLTEYPYEGDGNNIFGKYAVSMCYAKDNNMFVDFSAWGNTKNNGGDSASDGYGWVNKQYTALGFIPAGRKKHVARVGFQLNAYIYGIAAGYQGQEGRADYCWAYNNTGSINNAPNDYSYDHDKDTWGDPTSSQIVNGYAARDEIKNRCIWYVGNTYYNSYDNRVNAANGSGGRSSRVKNTPVYFGRISPQKPNSNVSYFIMGSAAEINGEDKRGTFVYNNTEYTFAQFEVKTLYLGAFVGNLGAQDGRLYRTDLKTGLPEVWHAAGISSFSVAWGYITIDNSGNRIFNTFTSTYNRSFVVSGMQNQYQYLNGTLSTRLVRGQQSTAISYTVYNNLSDNLAGNNPTVAA